MRQCPGTSVTTGLPCGRRNPRDDAPEDWACPYHKPGYVPKIKVRIHPRKYAPDEVIAHTKTTAAEHQLAMRFAAGHHFEGQVKQITVRDNFEWFITEASRIAVDMELGTWVDPQSGKLWEGGRFSRQRLGEVLGFPNARYSPPSFMDEPKFSRAVQWERIRREADMRMSSQTVKPLVSVAASAFLTELLNRALNHPEKISDRELITETRKYVEMLVSWDEGSKEKPHIQQTLTLLIQNINGLPASSRLKVRSMLGREMERGIDAIRQISETVSVQESA